MSVAWARRHWLFLLVFALGFLLRLVVQRTYEPAIFFADSFTYLDDTAEPRPDTQRPLGYPILFLRPLLFFSDLSVVPFVQHLLGLGMAAAIYATLVHHRVRGWLSALAVTPVLLDGYQLQIEENIASDTFFQALVVAALVLLIWHRHPAPAAIGAAGLLLGAAAMVRFVGLAMLVVPLLYAVVTIRGRRERVAGAGVFLLAAACPLLMYSTWTYGQTGEFRPGGDRMSGKASYARVAGFADCGALVEGGAPAHIVALCPAAPREQRPISPRFYMRRTHFGQPGVDLPPGVELGTARREFAVRVALNQPVHLAGQVVDDFLQGFAWERTREATEWPLETWRFPTEVRDQPSLDRNAAVREYGNGELSVHHTTASLLRSYQFAVYTRGPVFALGVVAALVAGTGIGAVIRPRLRAPALLVAGSCLALLLGAASFAFSWRYQLPAIPLLPWSAALGLAAVVPALRERPRGPVFSEEPELAGTFSAWR